MEAEEAKPVAASTAAINRAEGDNTTDDQSSSNSSSQEGPNYNFVQRQCMRIARWPKIHFWVAFAVSFGLSAFGLIVGNFSVSNEEGGWQSRGTLIADRTTQILMVNRHADLLFGPGNPAVWDDLTTNVQPGWEEGGEDTRQENRRRQLSASSSSSSSSSRFARLLTPRTNAASTSFDGGSELGMHDSPVDAQMSSTMMGRNIPVAHNDPRLRDFLARRLQEDTSDRLDGCSTDFYLDGNMTQDSRLWPVWKTKDANNTALNPSIVEELCVNEEQTQRRLEADGLCLTCTGDVASPGGRCLPPYGIVLYARLLVDGGMDMDCSALAQAWGSYQDATEDEWKDCVAFIKENPTEVGTPIYYENCPGFFFPSLVDEFFDLTERVQYTSSIFATTEEMVDDMYELLDDFGKGGDEIKGAYDTQNEDFINILADTAVSADMLLATGSALITTVAIIIHTRSLFLTLVGIVQIMLSFPLAFFAYKFIFGFNFFPFLNFIGVFVVFALGADHVFVAVDKWKNARLDNPGATTEEIAAKALPDAASAMLLTTSTTAIAFFGTAICPVAPVRLFAIFCGLLITFDYIMDVALIFPCLCIYDGYRDNPNCCIAFQACRKAPLEVEDTLVVDGVNTTQVVTKGRGMDDTQELNLAIMEDSSEEGKQPPDAGADADDEDPKEEKVVRISFIRRILLAYYNLLHKCRWPLLAASLVAFGVCVYYAMKLDLPTSSDVRLLGPGHEFEQAYSWRQNILYNVLSKEGGSRAYTIWGVVPADTGDHNDPASWSTLELDESFDPSTQEAQVYLREYCPRFFNESFGGLPEPDYKCAMNRFDVWLQGQYASVEFNTNVTDTAYLEHCDGAAGLPMKSDAFHVCMSAWSKQDGEMDVLEREGIVTVIVFPFSSTVRYDSPNDLLEKEWNDIENWMKEDQETAPVEARNAFFSSFDFWWYDTNIQMFRTAYGSAGIAIAASAVVILLSSRSLVMTLFSVLSIGYVLASVTSMMVAAGWTLGFLESICFAILIGVSVDFVIHFSHAYVALPGNVAREIRTKHALIDMGPSILAAAFTTMAGALIMLFCIITFFRKFAFVLFFAIIQATIGSFVVFLTMTDCIGPAEPTSMADRLLGGCQPVEEENATSTTQHTAATTAVSTGKDSFSRSDGTTFFSAYGERMVVTDEVEV